MQLRAAEVEGQTIRYRVAGKGDPLVLVHGLAGSWRWWSPLIEQLVPRRQLYLVDLPRAGHVVRASEMTTWLCRWQDAVGLEQADFAGHSLGGLFVAKLAAARPERTRRLVLVAPAGIPCGRSLPRRALPLVDALYDVRGWLPMVVADAVRTGPLSLAHGIAFVLDCDLRAELPSVRAPTLLAWGERDRLVPARLAEEWQRVLTTSRFARLGCGHVPMLEAPRALADCMLSFLDEELVDDGGDEAGARVVDGVRLTADDDQPAQR
jgi:pimeloyl-ACP methyl ester carboxylesterase